MESLSIAMETFWKLYTVSTVLEKACQELKFERQNFTVSNFMRISGFYVISLGKTQIVRACSVFIAGLS